MAKVENQDQGDRNFVKCWGSPDHNDSRHDLQKVAKV